jgi:hypothetical protein
MRAEFSRHRLGNLEVLHRIVTNMPEPRDVFRRALSDCMSSNPDSIRYIVLLMAFYLHVGPFSREVIGRLDTLMAAIEPIAAPHVRIEPATASLAL